MPSQIEIPKQLRRSLTPSEQEIRINTLEVCLALADALDPVSPICQALRDLVFMEKRIESTLSGKSISGDTI